MDPSPVESPEPNVVNLLGQRFHASVAIFYGGLGMVVGNRLRDWFPHANSWIAPLGLLMLFGGFVWWVVLWRRTRNSSTGHDFWATRKD